uniref:Uncharacterized protein n=1 Tax=Utricularia reniformis TaxID=192314 RepID=A0A1Y0AZB1_9LAMI|nr:hypothetical protein AEK19_MT0191 [Utricularia reniformis]ART30471.1 hypothetical protein AEK19_MT0191 [Utricularia reniformis]
MTKRRKRMDFREEFTRKHCKGIAIVFLIFIKDGWME